MTDLEKESGGLPTVAILNVCNNHCKKKGVNLFENEEQIGNYYDDGQNKPTFKFNLGCNAERYELVRKSDVKALIQDKIKIIQQMEKKQSNSLKLQGYREARRKLEELLEELKQ